MPFSLRHPLLSQHHFLLLVIHLGGIFVPWHLHFLSPVPLCVLNTSNPIPSAMRRDTFYRISVQWLPWKGILQARDSAQFKPKIKQTPERTQPHHAAEWRENLVKSRLSLALQFLFYESLKKKTPKIIGSNFWTFTPLENWHRGAKPGFS